MKIALTGATGFVGSHVLAELREHGHEVTAFVRDDAQADRVAARGATPAVVDLYDRPAVAGLLRDADGAIHTASPGDATSAGLDSAVVDAALDAFAATGKPYLQISGLWVYGPNTAITEDSPFNAPPLVAWKTPIERRVLSATGMRGAVLISGTAYGDGGGGIPGVLLGSPRDDTGNLIMIGTGRQHWVTVHVADLADAFRRVLEDDSARGYYVIGNGEHPTVAELTEAAPSRSARQARYPALTPKRAPASATTSPRSCWATRAPPRRRPGTSSAGTRPVRRWSASSGTEATGASRTTAPAARNRTKAPIRHRYGQPVTKLLQTGKHLARTPGARPPERIP
ncbi:MAG: NAD-dependent epimerase/dehydratase family protein [Trebonia sp.]|uniref:NAD-dependent epimerase/dehydratase family protein n=1 Tax=Trebonia sp. TaxID=2767075 RepID=UPI003C714FDD